MGEDGYHRQLKILMDEYVNKVYDCSRSFPKDEMFGVTSQLRRASLSVILNYIEGYARQRNAVLKNFLEISYGSLKESKYLIYFSRKRNYISVENYEILLKMNDRIGAMLWGVMTKI